MTLIDLEYHDGGQRCVGALALPAGDAPAPGIVVIHEAWGLGDHVRSRAAMLAELGYVALAADIFGERLVPADPPAAFKLIGAFQADPPALRARAGAAVDALKAHPRCDGRIGAIGFCFGGGAVLELARSGRTDIAGVVSFHGSLATPVPAAPDAVAARILVCHGADDQLIDDEQLVGFLREMRAARADCVTIAYTGGQHSFTNTEADGSLMPTVIYHERTYRRSWAAMRGFFEEVFAG